MMGVLLILPVVISLQEKSHTRRIHGLIDFFNAFGSQLFNRVSYPDIKPGPEL